MDERNIIGLTFNNCLRLKFQALIMIIKQKLLTVNSVMQDFLQAPSAFLQFIIVVIKRRNAKKRNSNKM